MDLPTVLIADDDSDLRDLLVVQLANDFEVIASARNADEAITFGARHQPDLAIIDMQMPSGGGVRATQELRKQSPGTAVVAYSGDESDAKVREVIAAGAIAYLRKGIPRKQLAQSLRDAIDAHTRLEV
jgi:DNA-binding NarL/FixJ family response regulator